MKDVVCEVLLRDTEVLTLRHIMKTRKVRAREFISVYSIIDLNAELLTIVEVTVQGQNSRP
jgi:hypothetical protein